VSGNTKFEVTVMWQSAKERPADGIEELSSANITFDVLLKGLDACMFDREKLVAKPTLQVHRKMVTLAIRAAYVATGSILALLEAIQKGI
jgi:hypothetical protein